MSNAHYLKLACHVLLALLICNLCLKLVDRYLLFNLTQWLLTCRGGECSDIKWWQRLPQLERLVWYFLDHVENRRQDIS
ncbi:uncharacterized protein TDEL_0B04570 [Torulaspora delbrueckii]|uniref:Uncharacterized protein n=1 Tax=Torulaspora delbrueckii TaxID=4950 RepID=G8ZPP2_TORDE|nr:hypothetical protein TDEL_0B04570 [Torulaspora delbrueckii]CCE90586.1 hypothetical protein TDEL_0B04570 [Torulaspora delbrueckii]